MVAQRVEGLVELAEEVFHMQVRLGCPQYVSGLSEVVRNPIYATGVGLLLFGQQNSMANSGEVNSGFGAMWAKMKSWFQGNF